MAATATAAAAAAGAFKRTAPCGPGPTERHSARCRRARRCAARWTRCFTPHPAPARARLCCWARVSPGARRRGRPRAGTTDPLAAFEGCASNRGSNSRTGLKKDLAWFSRAFEGWEAGRVALFPSPAADRLVEFYVGSRPGGGPAGSAARRGEETRTGWPASGLGSRESAVPWRDDGVVHQRRRAMLGGAA